MDFFDIANCQQCPRKCGVNRLKGEIGYCKADDGLNVASVAVHHGEEPPVSGDMGICNVFFAHCNLRCLFCQNHQISAPPERIYSGQQDLEWVVSSIVKSLQGGCSALGFVSPSHLNHQVRRIHEAVKEAGFDPVIVYNSNAYDLPEVIDEMADIVNVWLPDFKYMDPKLSQQWSDAHNYPTIALQAIKTMYKYAGSTLRLENGTAVAGMIIRHLVMPGEVSNSIQVLDTIADHLGVDVAISLMSQYSPTLNTLAHNQLGRNLYQEEYTQVVSHLQGLGFYKGWAQELESNSFYLPDFEKQNPFG